MIKKITITLCILIYIFSPIAFSINLEDELTEQELISEIKSVSGSATDFPQINSKAAVIFDRNSRTVICGKNENDKRAMASTTKIMTAIIVIEKGNLSDVVTVSKKAALTGGSRLGLKQNDKITVNDLLYGLMLHSGNDAAVALAEYVAGSELEFSKFMNLKAEKLDLKNTNFVTPHGLDNIEHFTTATELAIITDYALKIEKVSDIVKTKRHVVKINNYTKEIVNTNELLGYLEGVYGVKTGFTGDAGRCLVTAIKRDNLDIICIVLGADTKKFRTKDSIKLIEYVFSNYKIIDLKNLIIKDFAKWKDIYEEKIFVTKGTEKNLELVLDNMKYERYPVKNNTENRIAFKYEMIENVIAPVEVGFISGEITVLYEEAELFKVNVLNSKTIIRKGVLEYFIEILSYKY